MCNYSNYTDAPEKNVSVTGASLLSSPTVIFLNAPPPTPVAAAWRSAPYLRRNAVKVLSQHPPHVLACVRGHLVLEQEGELAALSDAVEVAVDLVVLAACQKKKDAGGS